MRNPCETHFDVNANDYCPICLIQEFDKLKEENSLLREKITEIMVDNEWLVKILSDMAEDCVKSEICTCGHPLKEHRRYEDRDECNLCKGGEPRCEFVVTQLEYTK
jgi:hypothetical protein